MKKEEQALFETNLCGTGVNKGIVLAKGITNGIHVTLRANTETRGSNEWLAEQLVLSVASTAFARSLSNYASQKNIELTGFECQAIGDAQMKNNIPELKYINIYPKIYVKNKADEARVKKLVEKTIENCPATHLLNAMICYHPVVEIKERKERLSKIKREVFF